MGIFFNEIIVEGKVLCGRIRDRKFYMNTLNPSNYIKPTSKEIEFTKEWLDITIEEFKAVREQLK